MLDELPDNSYDKESRELCYGLSGNHHGDWGRRIQNMFSTILPLMAGRVICCYGWTEDMEEINTRLAGAFEKRMQRAERLINEEGLGRLLKDMR